MAGKRATGNYMGPVRDLVTYRFTGAPQAHPAWYRPTWEVGHLVYQGGIPMLKRSSLTGGGFIPVHDSYAGKEAPGYQQYITPISSQTGSGFSPSRPNFLARLLGGAVGHNQ